MDEAKLRPGRPETEAALAAATAAAAVIVRDFAAARREPRAKAAGDYVTATDLDAERAAVAELMAFDAGIPVLAEEGGGTAAATMWVIDPLDGTTNFLRGYPGVGVSVALVENGLPVAAAVAEPMLGSHWWAEAGGGAFDHRGRRLRVREDAGAGVLATGFPFRRPERKSRYLKAFGAALEEFEDLRRPGAAALDLAYVANGTWDGFFELGLQIWDIAAGTLLVREAGGRVSDWHGDEQAVLESGDIIAAAPCCHERLLRLLRESRS